MMLCNWRAGSTACTASRKYSAPHDTTTKQNSKNENSRKPGIIRTKCTDQSGQIRARKVRFLGRVQLVHDFLELHVVLVPGGQQELRVAVAAPIKPPGNPGAGVEGKHHRFRDHYNLDVGPKMGLQVGPQVGPPGLAFRSGLEVWPPSLTFRCDSPVLAPYLAFRSGLQAWPPGMASKIGLRPCLQVSRVVG